MRIELLYLFDIIAQYTPLESTLFRQDLMRLAPASEVVNDRIATASCNDPNDIIIAFVYLLMLSISGYKREVARRKLLSLRTIRAAHNGAMATCCIYNRIWIEYQIWVGDVALDAGRFRSIRSACAQGVPSSPWWWTAEAV